MLICDLINILTYTVLKIIAVFYELKKAKTCKKNKILNMKIINVGFFEKACFPWKTSEKKKLIMWLYRSLIYPVLKCY